MTNTLLLENAIARSGKKKTYLAEKCGVTLTHFGKQLNNKYEFKPSQIRILCHELGLSVSDMQAIFFDEND